MDPLGGTEYYAHAMTELLSSIIVPTESPPTDIDFKRALLLFDRVHVFDPTDRELFAPHLWMHALLPPGLPFPVFMNTGAVLPLGKVPRYDDLFARAIDECKEAVDAGLLVVEQPPEPSPGIAIGNFPITPGRGAPGPILSVLRLLASSRDYLLDMARGMSFTQIHELDPDQIAPAGQALAINGPPLAEINDGSIDAHHAEAVRRLAVARLGSLVKCADSAEMRGLHLYSTDKGVQAAISRMASGASQTLASLLGADERYLVERASRVEHVLANMVMPDAILGAMSIRDILKARTRAWGAFSEKRGEFFRHVRQIAEECPSNAEFDARVTRELESYYQTASDLKSDSLSWRVRIGATATASVGAGEVAEQIFGVESWATMLAVAATLAGGAVAKEGPYLVKMWRSRRRNEIGAGRALAMPYSGLRVDPER